MTFRSRYSSTTSHRRSRRDDTRRAVIISIIFVVAIGVSLSLVAGVVAASYYSDHGAPIGSVNGEGISKDAVRARVSLQLSRDRRLVQDYLAMRNKGEVTADEESTLESTPTNNEIATTLYSDALTALQQEAELRQYAAKNGINITDQQISDAQKKDSTVQEMRHVLVITVTPVPVPPASGPTAADLTSAQTKAQGFLDEIKGGKSWTDTTTDVKAVIGGSEQDAGLMTKDDLTTKGLEPDFADAIFSLAKVNDVTAVFKDLSGSYHFATVTSIVPAYVDGGWQSAMSGDYSGYVRGLATVQAVKDVVNKKYIETATTQRHVEEIQIFGGYGVAGDGDEVKISYMVFAPNHSETGASGVATTDSAWADAKTRADTAVAALRADPTKWDSMARDTTTNDDTSWNTAAGSVPWIPADLFSATTQAGYTGLDLTNVEAAVFATGLGDGTILDPIQETSSGWVVVKFEGRRPAPDQRIADAQLQIATGSSFESVAQQTSDQADAPQGGDMGWISPYQLDAAQEKAIFTTPVGGVSYMVSDNNYFYIFKVLEEKSQTPDAATAARLKVVVYNNWLTDLTSNTNIWTDSAGLTAINPAASPT